jgi:hypothetical protein
MTPSCLLLTPAARVWCSSCLAALLQCCYSPDEKYVLTGTSALGKDSTGSLVVLKGDTLERVGEVEVEGSAIAVQVSNGSFASK